METLKRNMVNLGKGLAVWIVRLFLNTRGNEANVNGIKILLDTVLASMLISESQVGRRIAALTEHWGQPRAPSKGHFTEQAEILREKRITTSFVSESCMTLGNWNHEA